MISDLSVEPPETSMLITDISLFIYNSNQGKKVYRQIITVVGRDAPGKVVSEVRNVHLICMYCSLSPTTMITGIARPS